MELENTNKISSLIEKLSSYQEFTSASSSSSSSNQSESQNSKKDKESSIDEKYFHLKIKKLLAAASSSSFSNVSVELRDFFEDVQRFLDWVVKQKGISEQEASELMKEIKKKLEYINKIELDSFFINVSGRNVQKFLNNMKPYSFPNIEEKKILEKEKYTILVESTHSIKSAIKKKAEQMNKYHLFFSVFNEYFNRNHIYLREFHNYFFQRYFCKSRLNMNKLTSNDKKDIIFPFSENFILLIATDSSFKLFQETIQTIDKSQPPLLNVQDKKGKKYLKLYEKEKKDYDNENTIIENTINSPKQEKEQNYKYLNYLIKGINEDKNWIAKIIFFDMYFDLIIPKFEIVEGLTNINNKIDTLTKDNNNLKETVITLTKDNNILKETVNNLNKKVITLTEDNNRMLKFLKEKFPENFMSE